jgi:hypothetical protein
MNVMSGPYRPVRISQLTPRESTPRMTVFVASESCPLLATTLRALPPAPCSIRAKAAGRSRL